jgi:hypothetical protein
MSSPSRSLTDQPGSIPNGSRAGAGRTNLSEGQKSAGAFVGAGVEVAAGGGYSGVAEGSLDEVEGRAAVEGVGGMGVAEPVGGDGFRGERR